MGFRRVNEVETAGLRAAPQEKVALTLSFRNHLLALGR